MASLVVTDNLRAEVCPQPAQDHLPAASTPQRRAPIGLSPGFSVLTDSEAQLADDLDDLVELGITRIRVDLSWATLQPDPDRFSWSSADRVLDAASARGLHVLGVVGFLPEWQQEDDADGERVPPDPENFATFVSAAVERYAGQVGAWEIWNEPNTRSFWGANPDPEDYAALVAAATPVIRAGDPGAPVVIGSIAPADDGVSELSPATFTRGIYQHLDPALFDALSVHPYSYPAQATGKQQWNTYFRLKRVHRIMKARGDGDKQIWLTEYGAPTGASEVALSEPAQATMILTGIAEARRRSYTGPIYLYSLRDAGDDAADPEDNFGLLRRDGTPKVAYAVVSDATGPPRDCS